MRQGHTCQRLAAGDLLQPVFPQGAGRRCLGAGYGVEQPPQRHLMLQPAKGERAIGHEQPLSQLPLQGRSCQGSSQQSGCRHGIEAAALYTMAIGVGRCCSDGAQ